MAGGTRNHERVEVEKKEEKDRKCAATAAMYCSSSCGDSRGGNIVYILDNTA